VWLSPVQIKILPVSEKHTEYSTKVLETLKSNGLRVEMDDSDSLGKRIRTAKLEKVPYFLVIGDEEVTNNTATLEAREGKVGALPIADIISRLVEEIRIRT
jgi:threonyl-tRNA synthetase